ncbi:MAG: ParA family protein [Desulfobacteraceae bacterium]|jgi:chromosome partitioning protein
MPIISVTNQKGGVGKTTITYNLAKGLSARGYKVLAIDNDPQGNLTSGFFEDPTQLETNADIIQIYNNSETQVKPEQIDENLYLIGANIHLSKISEKDFDVIFQLKEGLNMIKDLFDFILIDCLPSFGYLHMAALNAADKVLIPIKPAPFAFAGLKDLFETIAKTKKRLNPDLDILGIILNLVEGKQTTMGGELEETLRENYSQLVFESRITKGVKLEESPSFLQSIMEYDPKGKHAQQFDKFIDEFLKRLDKSPSKM